MENQGCIKRLRKRAIRGCHRMSKRRHACEPGYAVIDAGRRTPFNNL